MAGMIPQYNLVGALRVPPVGSSDGGNRLGGGGDIHPPLPKQYHLVHYKPPDTRLLYGGVAESRGAGTTEMVGSGFFILEGHDGSGAGDRGSVGCRVIVIGVVIGMVVRVVVVIGVVIGRGRVIGVGVGEGEDRDRELEGDGDRHGHREENRDRDGDRNGDRGGDGGGGGGGNKETEKETRT